MAARTTPYGAFNFIVNIDGQEAFGGFSDVSWLSTDITVAEYRNGNERENHVRKVPGMHKVSDVTLKRGIVNSTDLWPWVNDVRQNGPSAKRTVVITMLDEAGNSPETEYFKCVLFPSLRRPYECGLCQISRDPH